MLVCLMRGTDLARAVGGRAHAPEPRSTGSDGDLRQGAGPTMGRARRGPRGHRHRPLRRRTQPAHHVRRVATARRRRGALVRRPRCARDLQLRGAVVARADRARPGVPVLHRRGRRTGRAGVAATGLGHDCGRPAGRERREQGRARAAPPPARGPGQGAHQRRAAGHRRRLGPHRGEPAQRRGPPAPPGPHHPGPHHRTAPGPAAPARPAGLADPGGGHRRGRRHRPHLARGGRRHRSRRSAGSCTSSAPR